jgi:hypothetical protein
MRPKMKDNTAKRMVDNGIIIMFEGYDENVGRRCHERCDQYIVSVWKSLSLPWPIPIQ